MNVPPNTITSVLCICLCVLLGSCATIFNGSTQAVAVKLPQGTEVSTSDHLSIPIGRKVRFGDTVETIRLARNRTQRLHFSYKKDQVDAVLEPSFGGGWLMLDLCSVGAPALIDLATGAWNSFDGLAVHFPSDSLDPERRQFAYTEGFNPFRIGSGDGLSFDLALGVDAPAFVGPVNLFRAGMAYGLSSRLSFIAGFSHGDAFGCFPAHSNYIDRGGSIDELGLGVRYRFYRGLYASAVLSYANITVDSLYLFAPDPDGKLGESGFSRDFATASLGLGVRSDLLIIELRQSVGVMPIYFPNGYRGWLSKTSLVCGLAFDL